MKGASGEEDYITISPIVINKNDVAKRIKIVEKVKNILSANVVICMEVREFISIF